MLSDAGELPERSAQLAFGKLISRTMRKSGYGTTARKSRSMLRCGSRDLRVAPGTGPRSRAPRDEVSGVGDLARRVATRARGFVAVHLKKGVWMIGDELSSRDPPLCSGQGRLNSTRPGASRFRYSAQGRACQCLPPWHWQASVQPITQLRKAPHGRCRVGGSCCSHGRWMRIPVGLRLRSGTGTVTEGNQGRPLVPRSAR